MSFTPGERLMLKGIQQLSGHGYSPVSRPFCASTVHHRAVPRPTGAEMVQSSNKIAPFTRARRLQNSLARAQHAIAIATAHRTMS
jgi:hypothetical protein